MLYQSYKAAFIIILFWLHISLATAQERTPTQIMIVGFDHLNQLYNQQPQSDVYGAKKQAELARLNDCLQAYVPDMILVEVDPSEQSRIDSLYQLYSTGKLSLNDLKEGRGRNVSSWFRLGKTAKTQAGLLRRSLRSYLTVLISGRG